MRLHAHSVGDAALPLQAYCYSTDAVGDAVYIMGDKVGARYQVTKVNIDVLTTIPSIGIITLKISATECVVQTGGIVHDVYTGLTPQAPLFIGTDSRLTEVRTPNKPTAGRRALQIIGQALSSTDLLLTIRSPIILTT